MVDKEGDRNDKNISFIKQKIVKLELLKESLVENSDQTNATIRSKLCIMIF